MTPWVEVEYDTDCYVTETGDGQPVSVRTVVTRITTATESFADGTVRETKSSRVVGEFTNRIEA